ncbi:MAG: methylenetetrahydrofolate reductase, partial [Betaproteobacteria bacterium]|nr:methylenetetrahydrofolate reductase [Betaproteobacteria bacterium]
PGQIVSAAAQLRAAGFKPVPHIAAREIAGEAFADDLLARLSAEAAVDQVLLIAGDASNPAGPYDSSAQFIAAGLLQRHGIRRIGLAGYPEGSPRLPAGRADALLVEKLSLAAQGGLDAYVVSQFCFEGETILAWLDRLKEEGIRAEIRVGLAGCASLKTLLGYALRCGVVASARALKSRAASITRLLSQVGPDQPLAVLAAGLGDAELSARVRLHFYPFGGVVATAKWLDAVREGRFVLAAEGSGFVVSEG